MEKNKDKTILIVLIIVLLLLICTVLFLIMNHSKNNVTPIPNVVENELNSETLNNISSEDAQNSSSSFSFKFLKLEDAKKNIIYSPLSIKYALKMLSDGANGNTKSQIDNLLGNSTLGKYSNIPDKLSLANSIFIRDTYSNKVKDKYLQVLNQYNTEVKYDSFTNANNINQWINTKTLGQIKNIIKDSEVQNIDNKMFLINALAIDMDWASPFDAKKTSGDTFYLNDGKTMLATMMNQETKLDTVSYYKDNTVTAFSMDLEKYDNGQMEFIAIMPEENLSNYISKFDETSLSNISSRLIPASKTSNGIDLFVPRFSFNYDLALKNDLIKSGVADAFNSDMADFSNMSTEPLYVSNALHKANIDFTEKGVKASAVTVMYMTVGAALMDPNRPVEIKINKPFLYVIREKQTGEIWFVGTVYEPNSWANDKATYEHR